MFVLLRNWLCDHLSGDNTEDVSNIENAQRLPTEVQHDRGGGHVREVQPDLARGLGENGRVLFAHIINFWLIVFIDVPNFIKETLIIKIFFLHVCAPMIQS